MSKTDMPPLFKDVVNEDKLDKSKRKTYMFDYNYEGWGKFKKTEEEI